MSNFMSIHFHTKRLFMHIVDIIDISFSYWKKIDRLLIHFRNFLKQKKVLCVSSKMQILRFYFVGQRLRTESDITFNLKDGQSVGCTFIKLIPLKSNSSNRSIGSYIAFEQRSAE